MIRSTKTTLKFANKGKLDILHRFIREYRSVVVQFIDLIWNLDKIPSLLPKELTSQIKNNSWLSARIMQCAGKQASGIVRGTQLKQKRRLFMIEKLQKEGKFKKSRKLQEIYNKNKISKPNINNIECELDERFVKINFDKNTNFDGWILLTSLGNKIKLNIPFKKHKHFNKMLQNGSIKKGIRISKHNATFMFDVNDVNNKSEGMVMGIDIGQTTTLSTSNGQVLDKCPHGHTYASICNKLAKKKRNSKNFNKVVNHRSNYLRYIVNKLNLDGVKIVNRENIKNLRKFTNTSRRMKHWNYGELFDVLDSKLEAQGVLVNKINPTYTSQRCSSCGWTRKDNRKSKRFKCGKCQCELDADLNASLNLSFNLVPITKQERLQQRNRNGFYWNVASKEFIVPSVQKTNCHKKQ
jgi:IS605 OrfB family transposase